jgi:hypothetical protein
MIFVCWCCAQPFPDIYRNVHHRIPESLGGKSSVDNLVDLCAGCHDALHAVAQKMLNKRISPGQISDFLGLIFKNEQAAAKKCYELASFVREAYLKTGETGLSENHLVSIQTVLRKIHKDLVSIRCRETGVTQEQYLRHLILLDLKTKYPNMINVLGEQAAIKALKKSAT